jgi:putative DNA primase/helicase
VATPYELAARDYLDAGWEPLPLPARQKSPVPTGYTGALGKHVTAETIETWLAEKVKAGKMLFKAGNVAIRLPKLVVGIDVDAYGEKAGEATLAAAEAAWGPLPRSWVTTSRDDGLSGIRLFRVPPDLAWPGQLPQGGGVELIRWDHRFAIVAPSLHDKTGNQYKWYTEEFVNGEITLVEADGIPTLDDIPTMPRKWVKGLTNGTKWKDRPIDEEMDARDLQDWLSARPDPDTPCAAMRTTVTNYARALRKASDDGGAHDAARDAAWAVLGDAANGHTGIKKALGELRRIFLTSVEERRADAGAARSEWARIVLRGAQKVSADSDPEESDPCESAATFRDHKSKPGRRGLAWEPLDELGNANRLVRVMAGRARWVESWGEWAIWSDTDRIWRRDNTRQVERWAVKAIKLIEDEIKHLDDEKAVKAYRAHVKASLNVGKQRAMIDMAKGRNGIILPAELFDSNPELLPVYGGTVELTPTGAKLREARQEDYATLRAAVPYKPRASNRMWDNFLNRFVPDIEVREWLQKLSGYSLLGSNDARLILFVIGKSSSGKTTFVESVQAALGSLAGPMPASVLRDNTDDKPRPDLLAAFPRRIVVAEELSAAQHLHPDQIKRLTGGGLVSARGMRSNAYMERTPAFIPWIVTNHAPTINSADVALYRRLVAVPFNQQIPRGKENITYRKRLLVEAREAVLAWLIEGYNMYAEAPASIYDIPEGALAANQSLRDEMSDVDVFLAECCVRERGARAIPSHLYDEYRVWCERNDVAQRDRISGTKFGRELSAKGFDKKQLRIDGTPTWFRVGLRLKERAN